MIEKIWENILASNEYEEPLVHKEKVDDVISLMLKHKVDPSKFSGNLLLLLSGGFAVDQIQMPSTKSIHQYKFSHSRPGNMPFWLIAGFPDFVMWFQEKIDKDITETEFIVLLSSLFGIEIKDGGDADKKLSKIEDYPIQYWGNAIEKYTTEVGKALETSVSGGSSNDIYLASDFFGAIGEDSNFTLIASMVTKYYLELKKSYGKCFPDETSLLAITGILDANVYIFTTKQIKYAQIIDIAKDTVNGKDRLLDFIIKLEVLIFSIESPEFPYEDVKESCESQEKAIRLAIKKATDVYGGEKMIEDSVRLFMGNPQFSRIRKDAGVIWDKMEGGRCCPKCGKTYDDSWRVCLACGDTLTERGAEQEDSVLTKIKSRNRKIRNMPLAYIIVGILVGFFYQMWGIVGGIIAFPIAVFVNMSIGATQGVRLWNQCRKDYSLLRVNGYPKEEALLTLSQSFHPELSKNIHSQIIQKFDSVDLLVNFFTGALPENKREEASAVNILNRTTIVRNRNGTYSVKTNRNKSIQIRPFPERN
ncbi:MAG: zinc ribbon domain-containing protein [Candidatus Omnitrophica bacterium]|nr:zinc ribbon domain-containing protein [Candidatus Omnitrophota bacterium]